MEAEPFLIVVEFYDANERLKSIANDAHRGVHGDSIEHSTLPGMNTRPERNYT